MSRMNVVDMKHEKIMYSIINKYHALSFSSSQLLIENCSFFTLPKFEHLAIGGKINSYEYFVLEGIVHRYNTLDGDSFTTAFYLSPSVITPNSARTIKSRSICFLQALIDSTIAKIPVAALNELRFQYDDVRIFCQHVVEHELSKTIRHEIAFRGNKAKERLLSLRKEYPNIENLVPHTLIASYLGLTPVSFSRLRNEMALLK